MIIYSNPKIHWMWRGRNQFHRELEKGDGKWNTKKTVLGWEIDSPLKILTLPRMHKDTLSGALVDTPNRGERVLNKDGT